MNKDILISKFHDEYIEKRMLGEDVNIDEFLKKCPFEHRKELKEDIENWEEIFGRKFNGSNKEIPPEKIDELIEKIQPRLI